MSCILVREVFGGGAPVRCPAAMSVGADVSSRTGGARESTTTITQQTAINGRYLRKKIDRDPETPCVQSFL